MNHLRMQILLSLIGGMMLGVAVLHLLPHGLDEIDQGLSATAQADASPETAALSSATAYAMPAAPPCAEKQENSRYMQMLTPTLVA